MYSALRSQRCLTRLFSAYGSAEGSALRETTPSKMNSVCPILAEEGKILMKYFPGYLDDLTSEESTYINHPGIKKRFREVLTYNVPLGRKQSSLTVPNVYRLMAKPEELTPENIRISYLLAWCVDTHQLSLLVTDDIIDDSEYRYKAACWYRKVGIGAINDGMLLEHAPYYILKKYCSSHPYYARMIEFISSQTVCYYTGQAIDFGPKWPDNMDLFTEEYYFTLIGKKASEILYYFPFVLAWYFSKTYDEAQFQLVKPILLKCGAFFQIEYDYFELYGDEDIGGGTDINKGKCTWLLLAAKEKANSHQFELLKKYYGQPGEEAVAVIKQLFEDLDIAGHFLRFKRQQFFDTCKRIQELPENCPQAALLRVAEICFQRELQPQD